MSSFLNILCSYQFAGPWKRRIVVFTASSHWLVCFFSWNIMCAGVILSEFISNELIHNVIFILLLYQIRNMWDNIFSIYIYPYSKSLNFWLRNAIVSISIFVIFHKMLKSSVYLVNWMSKLPLSYIIWFSQAPSCLDFDD